MNPQNHIPRLLPLIERGRLDPYHGSPLLACGDPGRNELARGGEREG